MTGVQTLVPIMLDHVNAGRLTLARFVDLTSAGPARLFGIAGKGRIAAGYDADLTIVDLKRRETITNDWIASRAGWTPYDGVTVTGWPVGTFVRGKRVMWQGELVDAVAGRAGAVPGDVTAIILSVIASAAKQSICPLCGDMDCFAALAMTDVSGIARPRRPRRPQISCSYCRASDSENSPLRTRAGNPSTNFATASSP